MRSGRFNVTKADRLAIALLLGVLAACPALSAAIAQDKSSPPVEAPLSPSYRFTEVSGEQLFAGVCQACHMRLAGVRRAQAVIPRWSATRTSKREGIRFMLWFGDSGRCRRSAG